MSEPEKKDNDGGKSVYSNTNGMPRDPDGNVIHVGVREGQVANRVISVGDPARAERVSRHLDENQPGGDKESMFVNRSSRGFTTYTGKYKGVPVSIIAIGMGTPMMDFMVREIRSCVDGNMAIVRFGTCGGVQPSQSPGDVAVATEGSVYIMRNPNGHQNQKTNIDTEEKTSESSSSKVLGNAPRYLTFNPQASNKKLSEEIAINMQKSFDTMHERDEKYNNGKCQTVYRGLNLTADSFYSSQGRDDPLFDDDNHNVLEMVTAQYPSIQSCEMETFQLFAIANSCKGNYDGSNQGIMTSAVSIIVANRHDGLIVSEEVLTATEYEGGKAVLDALIATEL